MIVKLRHTLRGAHVHIDVFVGDHLGSLALAGKLVMAEDEFQTLERGLEMGAAYSHGKLTYVFETETGDS